MNARAVESVTLRGYARRRGCQPSAVHQAITSGRIPAELIERGGDGRVKGIKDADAADAAWRANTQANKIPLSGRGAPKNGAPPTLGEARARLDAAKAELAELELAERQKELVEVREIDARLVGVFGRCKTKLLGVPSRARQQDPGLTVAQLALVDTLIREALEELAEEAEGVMV